jgi:capsular polysaccharide biosynthesis protein
LQLNEERTYLCDDDASAVKPVTYENIVVAFLILPVALIAALIVLLIEKSFKGRC